jgi:acyl-CoA thioesterase-1
MADTTPNPRFLVTSLRAARALVLALVLAASAMTPATAQATVRILALGDSLVHGYGLAEAETFPAQLQAALETLGREVEVINAGNSGDTSAAGLARLDWALMESPDIAIVEFGANDSLRGIDPGETYANLDAILARLAAEGVPVLLAGMLAPRNLGADYAAEFDAVFPRLAEAHGVALYPFFLDGVALQPDLTQDDGLHPNAAGVAAMVERIMPFVVRLLDGGKAAEEQADG